MRRRGLAFVPLGAVTLGAVALALALVPAAAGEEEARPAGREAFESLKCNLCHSVPAAGIESKTQSEKMKGPDLLAGEWDKETLAAFIKQEAEVDGEKHKKGFKGTDEELQALVDWLLEQKAEG